MDHSKEGNAHQEASRPLHTSLAVLGDGRMAELVYDPDKGRTSLAVWNGRGWTLEPSITLDNGIRLTPYSAENNLIRNEVILLPSGPGGIRHRDRAACRDPGLHPPLCRCQPAVRENRKPLRPVFVDIRRLQRNSPTSAYGGITEAVRPASCSPSARFATNRFLPAAPPPSRRSSISWMLFAGR